MISNLYTFPPIWDMTTRKCSSCHQGTKWKNMENLTLNQWRKILIKRGDVKTRGNLMQNGVRKPSHTPLIAAYLSKKKLTLHTIAERRKILSLPSNSQQVKSQATHSVTARTKTLILLHCTVIQNRPSQFLPFLYKRALLSLDLLMVCHGLHVPNCNSSLSQI